MTALAPAAALASAVYRGRVRHRRFEPRAHGFDYRLYQLYLDLDELDAAFAGRWLWSVERANLASFRRRDYLGPPAVPLKQAVLDRVEAAAGRRPNGPVRMLTHLRYLGFCFNPVTFYYCFDAAGTGLDAVVAEITNTPWRERRAYVLARPPDEDPTTPLRSRFAKDFHVSPFMAMDHEYRWTFTNPGASLGVHMENWRLGSKHFDATLTLERRALTGGELARTLCRHPFMTGKVIAAIYWQALRLKLKHVPVHPHPNGGRSSAPAADPPADRGLDR